MSFKSAFLLLAAVSAVGMAPSLAAQPVGRQGAAQTIEALNEALARNYVFPDAAAKIAASLRSKLNAGNYDALPSKEALANALTEDLIKVSGDLHFMVGVDPTWVTQVRTKDVPASMAAKRKADRENAARTNFGFRGVQLLDGNIGYIDMAYFADPTLAFDTAAAAMRMVENADAVIIDLRYNNGGYLEMAQFIASYFFPGEKDQLLFDYYYNEDGKRIERGQWVLPALPGKRMADKPLYILTGSTTFSAAEWLSYTMKKLGRARLVGALTAGGAHPVDRKPVGTDFFLQVPIGQIRDPVDHGDFEGVGVLPDIEVPSIDALKVAHRLALEERATHGATEQGELDWLRPSLLARTTPPAISSAQVSSVIGKYEGRTIGIEQGKLFYIWRDRFRAALTPVAPDLFDVEGVDDFRFRIVRKNGLVSGLERVNRDGSTRLYKRL